MAKIYKKEFEPVADIGDNIVLEPVKEAYKVVYVEFTGIIDKDFGPIGAGAIIRDQELKELELSKDQLGQFRVYFVDNIKFRNWRQPRGVGRFYMKSVQTYIDNTIQTLGFEYFGNLTEFFVFENRTPIVDVENPTTTPLSTSKVKFFGFKYDLEKLPSIPSTYIPIPVEGFAIVKKA
jgi:hypothetical protein